MGMRGHVEETRSRKYSGPLRRKRRDARVVDCARGEEVIEKLHLRRDVTAGHLYDRFHVTSWNLVLKKVLSS